MYLIEVAREEVARLPSVIQLFVTKSLSLLHTFYCIKLLENTVSLEKETKNDIRRRKNYFFLKETKHGEGLGAKYLEKE